MPEYGLIGKNLSHSFSQSFFTEKFKRENSAHSYQLFELENIALLPEILAANPALQGLNVTFPYKESIIPYLDSLDEEAAEIGAVNTIQFGKNETLKGYNTDHFGFEKVLKTLPPLEKKTALILGTGGASKAVQHALKNLGFQFKTVSRKENPSGFVYAELSQTILREHLLIVNCTPLGTFPNIDSFPNIPYRYLGPQHLLFDLVYNPAETKFLTLGKQQGARTENGLKMLKLQAEKAWEIWNT